MRKTKLTKRFLGTRMGTTLYLIYMAEREKKRESLVIPEGFYGKAVNNFAVNTTPV